MLISKFFLSTFIKSYKSKQFILSHLQIYVRSTDLDRTLISVYSNLAGFYSQDAEGPVRNPLVPVHAPVYEPKDAVRRFSTKITQKYPVKVLIRRLNHDFIKY